MKINNSEIQFDHQLKIDHVEGQINYHITMHATNLKTYVFTQLTTTNLVHFLTEYLKMEQKDSPLKKTVHYLEH